MPEATPIAVFAAVAAFGLTAAIELVVRFETELQIVGGLFLVALGIRTWISKPHFDETTEENLSAAIAAVFATTFFLTITNPATMLGFIAIFGGVAGLADAGEDYGHAATIVLAVIGRLGALVGGPFGVRQPFPPEDERPSSGHREPRFRRADRHFRHRRSRACRLHFFVLMFPNKETLRRTLS